MEAYQRILDALDSSSSRFQSVNEYYANLKEEDPNLLVSELFSVIENQEIPFPEREKLLPIISAMIPFYSFYDYQKEGILNVQLVIEHSKSLLQFFGSSKNIRDLAAIYFAKLRNLSARPPYFQDLLDFMLSENAKIEEIEASAIAMRHIFPSRFNNREFPTDSMINLMNSIDMTKDIMKLVIKSFTVLIKNSDPVTISNLFDLIFNCSLKIGKCCLTCEFEAKYEIIAEKADEVFERVMETVTGNPSFYECIDYMHMRLERTHECFCKGRDKKTATGVRPFIILTKIIIL